MPRHLFATPVLNDLPYVLDRHLCAYCGVRFAKRELSCDPVIPISKGGEHVWMNVGTACRPCNGRKADRAGRQQHGKGARNNRSARTGRLVIRPPSRFPKHNTRGGCERGRCCNEVGYSLEVDPSQRVHRPAVAHDALGRPPDLVAGVCDA